MGFLGGYFCSAGMMDSNTKLPGMILLARALVSAFVVGGRVSYYDQRIECYI